MLRPVLVCVRLWDLTPNTLGLSDFQKGSTTVEAKSTGKIIAPTNILRAARTALDLTQKDLAQIAGITERTLNSLETGRAVQTETRDAVQRALEARGVEFTNGSAPGFRLPKDKEVRL